MDNLETWFIAFAAAALVAVLYLGAWMIGIDPDPFSVKQRLAFETCSKDQSLSICSKKIYGDE